MLTFLLLVIAVNGQATGVKTLQPSQWYYENSTNIALATTGDSTLTYTLYLNKPDDVLYDVKVSLDSISGTPDYVLDLQGKVFESDSWTDLETDVNWTGTSTDTTVVFSEHSTAVFMRIFKLTVNGQAGTGAATVDLTEWKIWP